MTQNPFGRSRFRRSMRAFLFGRAAQAVLTLALTLLAVRLLPAADYGAYMVLWGLIEVGRPLSSLGLSAALQQFLPEMALHARPAAFTRFLWLMRAARLALLAVWGLAILLAWPQLTSWLGLDARQLPAGWIVASLFVALMAAEFAQQGLEALMDQPTSQTVRALLTVMRLSGLLALVAVAQVSVWTVILVDLASALVCLLLSEAGLWRRARAVRPDGSREFAAGEVARFAWHLSGVQMVNAIASAGTVRLLVSRALGVEAAGQFAFLQQLVVQATRTMPSLLLADVVRPMLIAQRALGDHARVAVAAGLMWKANVLLIWPLVPLMAVAGDGLISALSGGRIVHGGLPMAWLTLALASTAQIQVVNTLMQVFRHSAQLRNVSLSVLALPLLAWAGMPLGLPGAAAGVALGTWLRGLLGGWAARRVNLPSLGDRRLMLRLIVLLLAVSALAVAVRWAAGDLAAAAVMLLTTMVGVAALRPLDAVECNLLESALGPRARALRRFSSTQ
jgi:O-antigen/teichoic acid export membrane protein